MAQVFPLPIFPCSTREKGLPTPNLVNPLFFSKSTENGFSNSWGGGEGGRPNLTVVVPSPFEPSQACMGSV